MKREVTEGGALLDGQGRLNAPGWARQPVWTYRRGAVPSVLGLKEWDRLIVMNDRMAVGVALADHTYLGSLTVWTFDLATGACQMARRQTPATLGSTGLSEDPAGNFAAAGEGWAAALLSDGEDRALTLHLEKFRGEEPLDAALTLTRPPRDRMAAAIPFLKKDQFYYTCKTCGMEAGGALAVGNDRTAFGPGSTAVLDWSRGVLPHQCSQTWAVAWGEAEGLPLALNLAGGLAPGPEPSENGVFVDGVLHKLDRAAFHLPGDRFPQKPGDLGGSWQIVSSDKRLSVTFTPERLRQEDWNILLLRTSARQVFGRFSGAVTLTDGRRLTFRDLRGFVERSENKW